MRFLPKIIISPDISQFVYAVVVIILIPSLLAFNTLFLLHSVQRDTDYELNNKALLTESAVALYLQDKIASNSAAILQPALNGLVKDMPDIKAIEVFKVNQDDLTPLTTTSPTTKSVTDPILNKLAWSSDNAYSKQIMAEVGSGSPERIWLVASPVKDKQGKKVGLVDLYLSAAEIDAISNRTTHDSLIILVGTMVVTLLLLLNHFRFFEISILFKKLNEIDKLKDDFISMASHELKSPITVIKSYASVLTENPAIAADQEANRYLSIIYQSSERLRTLVDDILDVSRIEQKRLTFKMADYDLRSIINEVVAEYLPQAQSKGLKLTYTIDAIPLVISCDKDKAHQIFSNLVSNAVKYTPSGEISIYHQIKDGKVRTFVKDTGVGISKENREKLFSKFYRIYNDKTQDVPGTGLGLWITKQLVEKMNGQISVDSIENQGSQFVVEFPSKSAKTLEPQTTPPVAKPPRA